MNPLGNNTGPNIPVNPMLQNIAETIRFARTFQSPEAFMHELQRQNPQMAQKMVELSKTVRDPMQYATQMLSQQGITPQHLASLLQNK